MLDIRRVEPELLDGIPPKDPEAIRARRELRLVNALMRNAALVAGVLEPAIHPRARIADIGAGDGTFMLRIANALGDRGAGAEVVLVDRATAVEQPTTERFARIGWSASAVVADAVSWLASESSELDAVVANLFLHHFGPAELRALLAQVARRTGMFVACEPRRSAAALAGSHSLGLIGCGRITRRDSVTSVHAGFRGSEIGAEWPSSAGWQLRECSRGLFSHLFVAVRK